MYFLEMLLEQSVTEIVSGTIYAVESVWSEMYHELKPISKACDQKEDSEEMSC